MTKKKEEILNEFIELSRKREKQIDQICDIARKALAHNEDTHKVLKNIEESSEILKIFQDTNRPEITDFAKRLVEGRNEMAETKGEVKQMDKRIDENAAWMKRIIIILVGLHASLVVAGLSAIIKYLFFTE